MKICNHCQAAVEDEAVICSTCGQPLEEAAAELTEETELQETAETLSEETVSEEVTAEAPTSEESVPAEEAPAEQPKKKSRTGLIVGLVAAVLALVAAIAIKGGYDQNKTPDDPAETPSLSEPVEIPERTSADGSHHVNAHGFGTWSIHFTTVDGVETYYYQDEQGKNVEVSAEEVLALMSQTVATSGDLSLDNTSLAYYFNQEYYTFYSNYGSYMSALMDTSLALDEQLSLDGTNTWQGYFLDATVGRFGQIAALCQAAEAAGYTLDAEDEEYLASALDLSSAVASYGVEDADELLKTQFGPAASVESYEKFLRMYVTASSYSNHLALEMEISDEEIDEYYTNNEEMMVGSYGITKVDKNVVNVRHILIQPETTTAEDGTSTITDEAWAAAEASAQQIYDQWLAGDATEEAFAELATANSTDGGSSANGGLYTEVYPGQMVTEFNDWCFADGRQVGDHGIVKTSYGYHIMFFSGEGDYVYWRLACEELLRQEKGMAAIEALVIEYPSTSDLSKAILLDPAAPTMPAAEEETAESTEE